MRSPDDGDVGARVHHHHHPTLAHTAVWLWPSLWISHALMSTTAAPPLNPSGAYLGCRCLCVHHLVDLMVRASCGCLHRLGVLAVRGHAAALTNAGRLTVLQVSAAHPPAGSHHWGQMCCSALDATALFGMAALAVISLSVRRCGSCLAAKLLQQLHALQPSWCHLMPCCLLMPLCLVEGCGKAL